MNTFARPGYIAKGRAIMKRITLLLVAVGAVAGVAAFTVTGEILHVDGGAPQVDW